jgi:hypothetical protein
VEDRCDLMGYLVKAPLVQARKVDGSFVHIYEGGFLPDDPDPAQLEQLLAGDMVVEADQPEPPEVEAETPKPRRGRK